MFLQYKIFCNKIIFFGKKFIFYLFWINLLFWGLFRVILLCWLLCWELVWVLIFWEKCQINFTLFSSFLVHYIFVSFKKSNFTFFSFISFLSTFFLVLLIFLSFFSTSLRLLVHGTYMLTPDKRLIQNYPWLCWSLTRPLWARGKEEDWKSLLWNLPSSTWKRNKFFLPVR